MQTEIELLNYLKNFIISKEIFNIDIKYEDLDILKKYYDNTYEKVSVLVMDDEYVGITFDNLDRINEFLNEDGTLNVKSVGVVKEVVDDALNGVRNCNYYSFRSNWVTSFSDNQIAYKGNRFK